MKRNVTATKRIEENTNSGSVTNAAKQMHTMAIIEEATWRKPLSARDNNPIFCVRSVTMR